MNPNRKITKKFTKKFHSKVINIQYFHRKTGLRKLFLYLFFDFKKVLLQLFFINLERGSDPEFKHDTFVWPDGTGFR